MTIPTSGDAQGGVQPLFYVVSRKKFLALYLATMGLYEFFWYYENWTLYSLRHPEEKIWPAGRAMFAVFFIPSLFHKIDATINTAGRVHAWQPSLLATGVIVFGLLNWIVSILPLFGRGFFPEGLALLSMAISCFLLARAQRAANVACDDPDGLSNARFKAPNYVWFVVGAAVWIGTLYSLPN